MRKSKLDQGQSLFELVLAVVVVGVTLVVLVRLVGKTINNTTFSRDRTLANRHTQEAVEWLRGERDKNWQTFLGKSSVGGSKYCLSSLNFNQNGTCGGALIDNLFTRETIITRVTDATTGRDIVNAVVTTGWNDSQGYHESRVSTTFTDWRTN